MDKMAAEGSGSSMNAMLKQALEMLDGAAGRLHPKVEDTVKKITVIQKVMEKIRTEQQELDKQKDAVQKELQELFSESGKVQEELDKKLESTQILKLRRDSHLEKEKRQREQVEETRKRMADLSTKILEEKLKQRKQRMEFQDQLEDLMSKHKNLAEFYNPKRLEAEMSSMEERRKDLLQEEKEKRVKLKEVEESEARLIEKGVLTPENVFLRSKEAACAIKLFEEENALAKSLLEKATARHDKLLATYNRLKAELEAAERKLSQMPGASSGEISPSPRKSRSVHFCVDQ